MRRLKFSSHFSPLLISDSLGVLCLFVSGVIVLVRAAVDRLHTVSLVSKLSSAGLRGCVQSQFGVQPCLLEGWLTVPPFPPILTFRRGATLEFWPFPTNYTFLKGLSIIAHSSSDTPLKFSLPVCHPHCFPKICVTESPLPACIYVKDQRNQMASTFSALAQ